MQSGAFLVALVDGVARETTLFAAVWFCIGGIDDLLVDIVYAAKTMRARLLRLPGPMPLDSLPEPAAPIAIFVPAWDEAAVIGDMLRTALTRYGAGDYRIYVGTYPNDPGTVRAVAEVAAQDERVRLVIGPRPGPTTKADCLNALWRALLRDEADGEPRAIGVALHDAEDVVHPGELRVFAHQLARYDAVQLPVLPLRHPGSRWISGHYCDEFAEAHAKSLVVREALGAGLPFAGVGCAVRCEMLGRIADARGGMPFDETSLTEDYELGLTVATMGGRACLARVPETAGGRPVAVRAYFPGDLRGAVRQKARWMTGIALAGWDRIGWSAPGRLADHWMRMRDRRATLAMPVLALAYLALLAWAASLTLHLFAGTPVPGPKGIMPALLAATFALLVWRVATRALFVARAYGLREALLSIPRMPVANAIALLAARRALVLYLRLLAGGVPKWDKTRHEFPDDPERATA